MVHLKKEEDRMHNVFMKKLKERIIMLFRSKEDNPWRPLDDIFRELDGIIKCYDKLIVSRGQLEIMSELERLENYGHPTYEQVIEKETLKWVLGMKETLWTE